MTDDRSLERAARSWIEVGPTQAPDRAVEAALLRIDTTPQERDLRIPWRFPTMTICPPRRAAIVGVVLVGGAVCSSADPVSRTSACPARHRPAGLVPRVTGRQHPAPTARAGAHGPRPTARGSFRRRTAPSSSDPTGRAGRLVDPAASTAIQTS